METTLENGVCRCCGRDYRDDIPKDGQCPSDDCPSKTLQARRRHARIVHWLTQFDIKESKKKFHNIHALAICFKSLDENVEPALAAGKSLPGALKEGFCYPSLLLTALARGLRKDGLLTDAELAECLPKER